MSNFNDEKIDAMLKAYCTQETDTFTFKKPKKIKHTALIAACLVLVIMAGIIFVPNLFPNEEHSFVIVANAESLNDAGLASRDEITHDAYVAFATVSSNNLVYFDFDEPLLTDAPQYDLVKSYLFHSFFTNLHISVEGENIESVTYKASKGGFNLAMFEGDEEDWPEEFGPHSIVFTGYEYTKVQQTISYNEQENALLTFTPVFDPDETYESTARYVSSPDPIFRSHHSFLDTMEYVYADNYLELYREYGYAKPVGGGYHSSAPTVVTEEEKAKLKEYAEADNMRGFFNYQSYVFKRIIEEAEIDVTVTFTDGTKETKTLELLYTPKEITEQQWHNDHWYLDNQFNSYSEGTISARIK